MNNNNGFTAKGFLRSNLRFNGVVRILEVSRRIKPGYNENYPDKEYWLLKDENGASFSCWEEGIISGINVGEYYEIEGQVSIGKGSTYLNAKRIRSMKGSTFENDLQSGDFIRQILTDIENLFGAGSQEMRQAQWAVNTNSVSTIAELQRLIKEEKGEV